MNRSDEDKKVLLQEHFHYEVSMLQAIYQIRRSITAPDQFQENVILEVFLFHGRNLHEFFYYDSHQKDAARASQFLDECKDWKDLRPPKTQSLKELEKRVNLELTHLTYKRIRGKSPDKRWVLSALYDDLMNVVDVFMKNVADKYRPPN